MLHSCVLERIDGSATTEMTVALSSALSESNRITKARKSKRQSSEEGLSSHFEAFTSPHRINKF